MLAARGHRRRAGPGQPRGARDHAVPRGPRPARTRRASAAAKVGTTGRGIGPAYARSRVARRAPDGGPPRRARRSASKLARVAARQEPAARGASARPSVRASSRSSSRPPPGASGSRAAPRRLDVARPGRARGAATTSCSRAPRARSSTSTTARYPFVTSSQPDRRRRVHRRRDRAAPGRRGHRRHEGVLDARRVGPVPDRARSTRSARGSPSAATRSARRPGRPRRVGWFDAVPLRYAVAVNSRQLDHAQQARHPVGHRPDPAVRRLRDRRPAGRALAVVGDASSTRADADLRGLPGLGGADPRRPVARATCPRTPGAT